MEAAHRGAKPYKPGQRSRLVFPHTGGRADGRKGFCGKDHLVTVIRRGLRRIQYRPAIVNGCLAGTGLTIGRLTDLKVSSGALPAR